MKYKHIRTGIIYELLHIANECDNEKFPKMAVYQNILDKHVYARPYRDFLNKFVVVGGVQDSDLDQAEDIELNKIADSRSGQKRIRVNIDDL